MRVIAELCEHPGAENGSQSGLGQDDLSVRVPAKMVPTCSSRILTCSFSAVTTAMSDRAAAAQAAVRAGGWARCSPRSAARTAVARSGMFRRRARLRAALTWARVSFRARSGSGAFPSSSRVSGASRSSKASSAAGKYSLSRCRSRCTSLVRSQIIVLCMRASTLMASASGESPAAGRSWWESVRTMSASMCASPASLLARDTPCRSR